MSTPYSVLIRHDWQAEEVGALFEQPLVDTIFQAQSIHRQFFDPNEVQLSTLLNVKTGGAPKIAPTAHKAAITQREFERTSCERSKTCWGWPKKHKTMEQLDSAWVRHGAN